MVRLPDDDAHIFLTTTVLPVPVGGLRCAYIHRVRDRCKAWFIRYCSWRSKLLPSSAKSDGPPGSGWARTSIKMMLPSSILGKAAAMQRKMDEKAMRTRGGNACRTPDMDVTLVNSLLQKLPRRFEFELKAQMTCGGMSRIFETTCPNTLVKVSHMVRGFSEFEPHGYSLLDMSGIPAARMRYSGVHDGFLVLVVERLHCTVSSVIKTVARDGALFLDEVATSLRKLLRALRDSGVVFCDLSPDNIMVNHETMELVLIDPQFAVPFSAFASILGSTWAASFDTVHLALKIQAMGMVEADASVRTAADALCCMVLGHDRPPSKTDAVRWLQTDVPLGLRIAYSILQKLHADKKIKSALSVP